MRDDLLVATVNGLFLLRGGEASLVAAGDHYGVTWDRRRVYAACRARRAVRSTADGFSWRALRCPWALEDMHQLLWRDGTLLVTDTKEDRIGAWDGAEWREAWRGPGDGSEHVNSLWADGRALWVVEHRFGAEPARVRAYDRGFRLLATHEFRGLNTAHNCGLHNAYVEDGKLHTLSVDKLVVRDLALGTGDAAVALGGYMRGLARTRGRWYVGHSRATEREHRAEGDAEVLVLDDGFEVVERVTVPDVGQIHEVRALRGDRAHNGLDCPW